MKCKSDKCDLAKNSFNPCLSASGSNNPKVYVLNDVVRKCDDTAGENLSGETGIIFREMLEQAGFNLKKVMFSSAVKCRKLDNRLQDASPSATEAGRCKVHCREEISKYKPELIILLGNAALKAIVGKVGITNFRGKMYQYEGIPVIPTLSPEIIKRDPSKIKMIAHDINLAADIYLDRIKIKVNQPNIYTFIKTIPELKKAYKEIKKCKKFSFDTETNSLIPYLDGSKILCVTISTHEGTGYFFPLHHPESPFKGKRLKYCLKVVKKLMESKIFKIAQNGKFDINYLKVTEDIDVINFRADTLLMEYTLNEEPGGKDLDTLAWKYTSMGGYSDALHKYVAEHPEANTSKGGNYGNIPIDILFRYAVGDTDATLRVYNKLKKELKK